MTQVIVGDNEHIESALRRFKREVSKAGIFPDMRKHRHFETPLEKRKRKEVAKHRQSKRSFRNQGLIVDIKENPHRFYEGFPFTYFKNQET